MKKIMITFLVSVMMALTVSNAFAAFGNLELIRVVSDSTSGSTVEVATDLGSISSFIGGNNVTVGGGINAFTNFFNPSHNLSVNYYAWQTSTTTKGTLYIASNNTTAPQAAGSSSLKGKLNTIQAFYAGLSNAAGGATTIVTSNTAIGSFGQQMGMTALGEYGGYTTNFAANANVSLASLATAPVNMTLWQFANNTAITGASTGALVGPAPFTITTNADGSTSFGLCYADDWPPTTSTVPIPPAFFLMGSGLIGLFGMRKRNIIMIEL